MAQSPETDIDRGRGRTEDSSHMFSCPSQVSPVETKQFLKSLHLRWEICQGKRKETERLRNYKGLTYDGHCMMGRQTIIICPWPGSLCQLAEQIIKVIKERKC